MLRGPDRSTVRPQVSTAISLAGTAVQAAWTDTAPSADKPEVDALQRAFEDVGVEFLPDDDVRVRSATPPDK
jgi:hypothetical protein